jgi:hypothetical protein
VKRRHKHDATILGYGWAPMPSRFRNRERLALFIAMFASIPSVDTGFTIAGQIVETAKKERWPEIDHAAVERWMFEHLGLERWMTD